MDAALNLAFSMHKNPGIYALLLGSGISRSVGIPTGWEVTQDIFRQLGAMGNHGLAEDIRYDELFTALGKTQTERNSILRGYFEPTPEESEKGLKIPSKAHRAIAELVKSGYIKVILTTNFDRLMEIALEDIGITPDIVRSDDMLLGAVPIRHSAITIIQLHGDYRDVRTLNTPSELATYSAVKNKLLDTIFEEYGLIVCGWSATWDAALRDAIFRVQSRRYSTYWIEPYELSQEAKDVINHRSAELIPVVADDVFTDLQSKVEALERLNRQHPLTVAVAVERVKKGSVRLKAPCRTLATVAAAVPGPGTARVALGAAPSSRRGRLAGV
ncbi:MAG: SIR2 family protein, partial [Anaerolineae bacterium]|nr:SIR2 family protein [Anaerolineae bacterium]